MALLSKDDILSADDLKAADVPVPEWGGTVRVRTMTGSARDEYEQVILNSRSGKKDENIENIRALMLVFTLVDDDGELVFSRDDVDALGKKSVKAMDRVFAKAAELNAMRDEDIEELAGN